MKRAFGKSPLKGGQGTSPASFAQIFTERPDLECTRAGNEQAKRTRNGVCVP